MKTIKILKNTIFALVILSCGFYSSCKDEGETYDALSVTKVSTVLDRKVGVNTAELAQFVIVQGTGLNAVTSILVNDVSVDLKEAFITSNEITFQVPRVIPIEINNLITVKTETSQATLPIEVNVPTFLVAGMYNEYTPKGKTMKIVGDFFDLYQITTEAGEVFFGDEKVTVTEATGTSISFVVPSGAADEAKVKLVSPVCGEVMVPGKYRERGNMLIDFDPFTGWGGGRYVSDGPTPEPISGSYSHFKLARGDAGDWAWADETAIAMVGLDYWPDVTANPQNYLLKFEACTLLPLTKRQIRFYFSQINYNWEPFASGLAFSTNGEWQTVSISLDEVWNDEVPNDGVVQILGNSYAEDTDISFDNIRIVKKD